MADLVLIHGITESRRSWDPLIDLLRANHRVIAIDLLGHGDASRTPPFGLEAMTGAAIQSITTAGFDPQRCVLIGHSLGGMIASSIASVLGPLGVINVDQSLRLGDFQAGLQQLEPLLRGDDAAFQSAISMVFDQLRGPLSAGETARIESLRAPVQEVVLSIWDPVLTSPASDGSLPFGFNSDPSVHHSVTPGSDLDALVDALAGSITVPYLSLHGIDPGTAYRDWITSAIPSATCEVWADHGHYPHLVDPTRFIERVNAFVALLS
jgi:pimeloyl-ACP methyl ester carboxylesterase